MFAYFEASKIHSIVLKEKCIFLNHRVSGEAQILFRRRPPVEEAEKEEEKEAQRRRAGEGAAQPSQNVSPLLSDGVFGGVRGSARVPQAD